MARGSVVVHLSRPASFLDGHEGQTLCSVARRIARLKGLDYGGPLDGIPGLGEARFVVPDETLVRPDADALGVRGEDDLFGGIVPYPFVQTKAISHGLVHRSAAQPEGWAMAFAEKIADAVLPGFTAFSRRDARRAIERLLADGAVRAKRPRSAGGHGQRTLRTVRDGDALLDELDDRDLAAHGLVLELHLDAVTTLSLGRVTLGDTSIAYYGHQRMTHDNAGRWVYGGSHLTCVRGGWDVLETRPLDDSVRVAVRQARRYEEAIGEYGVVASRRNYDVGQGVDRAGRSRSGVFEASWRVGGATPAEVAALEVLTADPSIDIVHTSSVEEYGSEAAPPTGAVVHFHGVDPKAGPLVRYALVRGTSRRAA